MSTSDTYTKILKSYEDNPKVQILRKIRGKKALEAFGEVMGVSTPTDWLAGWTATEKRGVRGFVYKRQLRKNSCYGVKLISQRGGKNSVLGHEVLEADGEELFSKF